MGPLGSLCGYRGGLRAPICSSCVPLGDFSGYFCGLV